MNELFTSIVSGLTVAIFTSFITVQLSLRRFYSEKWWERKADTYTDIVEALHAKLEFLGSYFAVTYDDEQLPREEVDRLRHASKEADKQISKIVGVGTFVISEEVELIFHRYRLGRAKMMQEIYEENEEERFRYEYDLVANCLDAVRDAAMSDLKVTPRASLGQILDVLSVSIRQRLKRRKG